MPSYVFFNDIIVAIQNKNDLAGLLKNINLILRRLTSNLSAKSIRFHSLALVELSEDLKPVLVFLTVPFESYEELIFLILLYKVRFYIKCKKIRVSPDMAI